MDEKAVEAWHLKIKQHPDRSQSLPGVTELDSAERVQPATKSSKGRLKGTSQFSIDELSQLADLAQKHASKTSITQELRGEIKRRNG